MNIKRDCFYGNNDCNCNVSESSHVDYLVQISRETRSDNVHDETHINTNGQRKEENREKKGMRETIVQYLHIFKSVSMHVLLLLRVR